MVLPSPVKEIGIRTPHPVGSLEIAGSRTPWKLKRIDGHQLFSIRKWQWSQQNAIHQAEDRGSHSNAQGEREDDCESEPRTAAKLPDRKVKILPQRGKHAAIMTPDVPTRSTSLEE